jgi:uncharacterized protein YeeX (DUF496 family)
MNERENTMMNVPVEAIETLIEAMKADYNTMSFHPEMVERYNNSISYKVGKKYIKIISNNSVSAFIVNVENDKNFRLGDIVKPASWAAPARNFARGNVIDGGYTIRWTGA